MYSLKSFVDEPTIKSYLIASTVYLEPPAYYDANMDLLVKDYLRTHTFQQLEDEHGVCARPGTDGKYALNYDQLLAKSGDPVAEQCRGLVIRPVENDWFDMMQAFTDGDWKDIRVGDIEVLAWPLDRFYNHGDPAATNIDWSHPSLKVYEKVDGTCIILYWDPAINKWNAGTRSVPDADLPIQVGHLEIGDMTFSQLFMKALVRTRENMTGKLCHWLNAGDGPDKVIHLNQELTYVFELVSTYNQIVVVYPEPTVYLLAARHTQTGKEFPIENLRIEHVRRPRTWEIRDVAALACFVDEANPAELEGAVVCVQVGDSFKRLKVKNKTYVLAHKSKDSVMSSQRNALETVIREKVDDIVPLVPANVQDVLFKMQDAYRRFCSDIDHSFAVYRDEAAGSRKEFALKVQASGRWQAPYFNMWEKRASSCREWIKGMCERGKLSDTSLDTILGHMSL
jgi:hypothetical protein